MSSNGGLPAHRDLDDALGLFDSVSTVLTINAQAVISNMLGIVKESCSALALSIPNVIPSKTCLYKNDETIQQI